VIQLKIVVKEEVRDINIDTVTGFYDLIKAMDAGGGFAAKNLAVAESIYSKMMNDKESFNFLSYPADIVSTGMRGILSYMTKKKMFKAIITTAGTVDHDLARSLNPYYHGDFNVSDVDLHKSKIHRLGNIFIPVENYGIAIERYLTEFFKKINKKKYGMHEIIWELGRSINNESSILYWAYVNKIPVIIPGFFDGAFGYQLWQYVQMGNKLDIDFYMDESLLSEIVFKAKRTGALIIGGGISKHHTIWWNQFKEGLDYAIYITTAQEFDGSLSGARPREAISWGKIKEKGLFVTVDGDATIIVPLIVLAYLNKK
jgi:deoxyhypusine synthase